MPRTVFESPTEVLGPPDVSRDGRRIFLVIAKPQGNILLATLASGVF
jgi:hypothetical protein